MKEPALPEAAQQFVNLVGIDYPIIGGPMYPCSNPELVAAVSAAGGLGVLQPISLTYVYDYDFRAGIRLIRELTDRPIGMNALIEKSSKKYQARMSEWIDIGLEEGVRFFVTSLGKPDWVADLLPVKNVGPVRCISRPYSTRKNLILCTLSVLQVYRLP